MFRTRAALAVLREMAADPGRPRYPAEVVAAIGLPKTTVYQILERVQDHGWAVSQQEDLDPVAVGRPPRRYYTLNPGRLAEIRAFIASTEADLPTRRRRGSAGTHLTTRQSGTRVQPSG